MKIDHNVAEQLDGEMERVIVHLQKRKKSPSLEGKLLEEAQRLACQELGELGFGKAFAQGPLLSYREGPNHYLGRLILHQDAIVAYLILRLFLPEPRET